MEPPMKMDDWGYPLWLEKAPSHPRTPGLRGAAPDAPPSGPSLATRGRWRRRRTAADLRCRSLRGEDRWSRGIARSAHLSVKNRDWLGVQAISNGYSGISDVAFGNLLEYCYWTWPEMPEKKLIYPFHMMIFHSELLVDQRAWSVEVLDRHLTHPSPATLGSFKSGSDPPTVPVPVTFALQVC